MSEQFLGYGSENDRINLGQHNQNCNWSDNSDYEFHSRLPVKKIPSKRNAHNYRKGKPKRTGNNGKMRSRECHGKAKGDNTMLGLVLHAKQRKIDEIEDELIETRLRYQSIVRENKTLKSMQKKQEYEINKLKNEESEVPKLISQQAEEQRVLRCRLKRAKAAERDLEVKVRQNNNALLQMEGALDKLKRLVQNRELGERAKLSTQLSKKQNDLETALNKIDKLGRLIELSECSFSRQLCIEKKKHNNTLNKLYQMEEDHKKTQLKLKKKEKELSNADVYSLRKAVVPPIRVSNRSIVTETIPDRRKNNITPVNNHATNVTSMGLSSDSDKSKFNREDADMNVITTDMHCEQNDIPEIYEPNITSFRSNSMADGDRPPIIEECGSRMSGSSENAANDDGEKKEDGLDKLPCLDVDKQQDEEKPAVACNQRQLRLKEMTPECSKINEVECKPELRDSLAQMRLVSSSPHETNHIPKVEETKEAAAVNKELETNDDAEGMEAAFQLDQCSTRSQRKPYVFSKEIENLHRGIPSIIAKNKSHKYPIDCDELRFGNYLPTFNGAPKRKNKSIQIHKQIANRPDNKITSNTDKEILKGTKESDLLLKLFGKIEVVKDSLLGMDDETAIPDDEEASKSRGHGDNFDMRSKYQFRTNQLSIDTESNREIS